MKKIDIQSLFFLPALLCVGMSACQNFNTVMGVEDATPVTVSIVANVIHDPDEPSPPNLKVRFINFAENWSKEVEMDQSFTARVDGIVPGNYSILVFGEYKDGDFTWMYSGSVINQYLFGDSKSYTIDVKTGRSSSLVIKEIFYSGSRTPTNGTYYHDQFYEIYNNSESTVYLDSVCYCTLYPSTATAPSALPVWNGDDWEDFVYANVVVWQIPGNGTTYPLQSGESALLASRAENHTVALYNPNSLNMISSEFEFWRSNTAYPTDQPAINLTLAFGSVTSNWLTTVNGAAFVLFRQKGPIDRNFTATHTAATTRYFKIRRKDVLDGVECVNNWGVATNKRMPVELDAGATTVEGTYNSRSVSRKIQSTRPDGTNIYQDTNNSTEDFEVMSPPVIRRYGAKIPSWNTWHSLDPQFP